jgi:hypothetical protein
VVCIPSHGLTHFSAIAIRADRLNKLQVCHRRCGFPMDKDAKTGNEASQIRDRSMPAQIASRPLRARTVDEPVPGPATAHGQLQAHESSEWKVICRPIP